MDTSLSIFSASGKAPLYCSKEQADGHFRAFTTKTLSSCVSDALISGTLRNLTSYRLYLRNSSMGFLRLPPELRNRVYAYLYTDYESRWIDGTIMLPELAVCKADLNRELSELIWSIDQENAATITKVCRQTRNEALEWFLTSNAFTFRDDKEEHEHTFKINDPTTIADWIRNRVPTDLVEKVAVISLVDPPYGHRLGMEDGVDVLQSLAEIAWQLGQDLVPRRGLLASLRGLDKELKRPWFVRYGERLLDVAKDCAANGASRTSFDQSFAELKQDIEHDDNIRHFRQVGTLKLSTRILMQCAPSQPEEDFSS